MDDASDTHISYFVIYVFYCFYSVICSFNFRAVVSATLPVHYCIDFTSHHIFIILEQINMMLDKLVRNSELISSVHSSRGSHDSTAVTFYRSQ